MVEYKIVINSQMLKKYHSNDHIETWHKPELQKMGAVNCNKKFITNL